MTSRLYIKKVLDNNILILKLWIIILFGFYCYLATLPKHGDFYALNYMAKILATGNFDVYQEFSGGNAATASFMHPPAFYILQGFWIKLGSYLFNYDLNMWTNIYPFPYFYPFWGMIPYLLALIMLVISAYLTLKNKWLCLICYGTFTFISVIIMGQTDIFCALFIYLSLLFALKSFEDTNPAISVLISLITLGLSMTFKFYGGMLFPIYLTFFFFLYKFRQNDLYKVYGMMSIFTLTFILSFIFIWMPYAKWFGNLALNGESSFLFRLQIAPISLPPYHTISIWLLGYLIILYDLVHNIISKTSDFFHDKRNFIFYSFVAMSWFFVSVYSNPQWWVILIPSMLLVLDNFHNKINYFFACSILALFWFFPMMWVHNIDMILDYYIAVVPIEGNLATILSTSIIAVLVAWVIEVRSEITSNSSKKAIDTSIINRFELAMPVTIIFIIIIIIMHIYIPHV